MTRRPELTPFDRLRDYVHHGGNPVSPDLGPLDAHEQELYRGLELHSGQIVVWLAALSGGQFGANEAEQAGAGQLLTYVGLDAGGVYDQSLRQQRERVSNSDARQIIDLLSEMEQCPEEPVAQVAGRFFQRQQDALHLQLRRTLER